MYTTHILLFFHMRIKVLLFIILAVSAVACNDDIFVKPTAPSSTDVTIDGDGGECTVTFQPEALQSISIDNFSSSYGITCYNSNGDVIPVDSPASEIARMNYTTMSIILDIFKAGDKLTFHCTENTVQTNYIQFYIRLNYGFAVELVSLVVLPGRPMELVEISYDMQNMREEGPEMKETHRMRYENNSSSAWIVDVWPYLNANATALLESSDSWAKWIDVEVNLPTRINGRWELSSEKTAVCTNTGYSYFPAGIDQLFSTSVDIPAKSVTTLTCGVNFYSVYVPYSMLFRNPVTGREAISTGICNVTEPADYEIELK